MNIVLIGLVFAAFLNVPPLDIAPAETKGVMNLEGAPAPFDGYGACSITDLSAQLKPEFRAFEAWAFEDLPAEPAVPKPRALTDLNPHFQVPLYEIKNPAMARSTFLLGSDHNIPLESYPEIVTRTAAMAEVLVTEIVSEESLLSPRMAEFGLYNATGFGWLSKLNDENQKKLELLPAAMDNYHPALVYFLFSRMGVDVLRQSGGINAQLQAAFAALGRPRLALETRRERVAMGTGIDPRSLVPLARTFSLRGESLDDLFTEFCARIQSREPTASLESYAAMDQEVPVELDPVYHVARNQRWLPRLLDAIHNRFPDRVILVDVGFLHLPGDMGLLNLLERAHYAVTRVEAPR